MASIEQILYDQAVFDATFQDVNLTYQKYIEKLRLTHRNKFNQMLGAYNPTQAERQAFENKLAEYLTNVMQAHNSFVSKGGRKDRNAGLIFKNQTAANDFDRWIDEAAQANLNLHDFKQDMKTRALFGIDEQITKKEQNSKKNKGRLKTLGAILAAGALGTAAYFGTKAVIDNVGNAEDDIKTDRIEHRVNTNKAGIRQGKTYDFESIETSKRTHQTITYATDKSGNFVRTQRVQPQRPTVDSDDVVVVEEIEENEVRHQTEEVSQPELPTVVEEVIEEVYEQPQPQVIEKTVVIEKEVPQIIEKTVVVEKEVPVPVPQPTIEEVQTQVEANTVAYQTAMAPAPVVVSAPQPAPVVVSAPSPVIIDNGPNLIDVAGAVVGGVISHAIDHHHHHGHIGRRSVHPPVGHLGRPHVLKGGIGRPHISGPVKAPRPTRVGGSRPHGSKLNCAPTPGRPGVTVRPSRPGSSRPGIGARPTTQKVKFTGRPARTSRPTSLRTGPSNMRTTLRKNSGLGSGMRSMRNSRPTGGNRGARPSGGRGGRGGRR